MLSKVAMSLAVAGMALVPLLWGAPAHAQANRTWVSGVGDDANPCSRTAPCKTFAGSISKTAKGGEVNCIDPGGFGGVTVTKSITIDCYGVFASTLVTTGNGILINTDAFPATPPAPVVRLRNLAITGVTGGGTNGVRIIGANSLNTVVIIENVVIDGFSGHGISDERTGGGELFVTNTTVRNNGGNGISLGAVKASLDRVRAFGNGTGVSVATGAVASIANSVVAANTTAGVKTDGTALAIIDTVVITGSGTGVQVVGGTVSLNNSEISFNATAATQGTVTSYKNNRFFQNAGTVSVTTIGSTSIPTGLQ